MEKKYFSLKISLLYVVFAIATLSMLQAQTPGGQPSVPTGTTPAPTTQGTTQPNTSITPPPTTVEGTDNTAGTDNKSDEIATDDNEDATIPTNEEFEAEMERREGADGYRFRHLYLDGLPIFAGELFTNAYSFGKNLTNRPTPLNYPLGPGDQLVIEVTGINVVSFHPTVQPDGSISLREFGRVFVGGKTIDEAREIIKGRLNANKFSIDRGSSLDVNISNVRSFTITVMGQVASPGTKVVGTFNTVLDALNLAGGITRTGSYRYVQLVRNNQVYAEIDLYDWVAKADFSTNYFLKDNDIIVVPMYRTRVALKGEVKREAWFEVKSNESLWDIISYAGGFTAAAYTNFVKATQFTDEQKRIRDIAFEDLQYFNPVNGDQYRVERVLDRLENRVTITGALYRPGQYELESSPTLLALIEKAGGLREEAFTTRALLTRTNPDNGALENVTIDLQGILSGKVPDIELRREDVVHIKSIYEMSDHSIVTIAGKIRNPGAYFYYEGMTIEDLVMLADGFTDGANYQTVYISRRVKDSDRMSKDAKLAEIYTVTVDPLLRMQSKSFVLEPYDVVSIMPLPGHVSPVIVEVEGQVMNPGTYPLIKRSDRISDLIFRAGGITELGDIRGATLYRPREKYTHNEKVLDNYRRQLRKSDLQADLTEDYMEGAVRMRERGVQLDPNVIALDLEYILKHPGSDQDLILQNGDRISIPVIDNTIEIQGQVGFPTIAVYVEGKDLLDYIYEDAGGFTESALKRRTKVEYRNGRSSTKKLLGGFPRVEPGSIIYVPPKTIKQHRRLAPETVIALSSSVASALAVIYAVLRIK